MNKKFIVIGTAVFVLTGVVVYFGFNYFKSGGGPLSDVVNNVTEPSEIVPAPDVTGKIKGYWSSRGGMIRNEIEDAEKMKEVGINTITFSPSLSHDEEGNVSERGNQESFVKQMINKIHEEGFRVMLETTPMNSGAVDTHVKNPKLFTDEMTRVSLEYAAIAEEYNVEYFAPIVEPVHHISVVEADEWLQELLPRLKEVYSGPIMWKKQSMHLSEPKDFSVDHEVTMKFRQDKGYSKFVLKEGIQGGDTSERIQIGIMTSKLEFQKANVNDGIITKYVNIGTTDFHTLKVRVEDKNVLVYLDDVLLITYEDRTGPTGGYALGSDGMTVSSFEIKDLKGKTLLKEGFKNLVNWGNKTDGFKISNNQIVVTSNDETYLLHDIDFSGYDYIAIDTFRRGQAETSEEYLEDIEYVMDKTVEQAKVDGVPYVILAEFGGSIEEEVGWRDHDVRAKIPITAEELAYVTKTVLELAEERLDGYIYNGWDIEGQGINQLPEIEAVIKDWYNSH